MGKQPLSSFLNIFKAKLDADTDPIAGPE